VRIRTSFPGVFLLVFSVLLAGCSISGQTKQSLVAYTTAMEQVHIATDQFLVDFAAVDKLKRKLESSLTSADVVVDSYPYSFDPATASSVSTGGVGRDIQARRDALIIVANYNNVLVALATGQTESEINALPSSFGSKAGLVLESLGGSAIPGLQAVIPLASQLTKLIQDGLNKNEFDRALELGQPLVEAILDQLEADTTQYYEASIVVTNNDRSGPKTDIRTAAFAIQDLTGEYAEPTDPNLQNELKRLNRELSSVGKSTNMSNILAAVFKFDDNKSAYDEDAHRQVLIQIQKIGDAANADAQLVARQNAYYDLMGAYAVSIRQTKASLIITRVNLNQPASIEAEAGRLLNVALNLRDSFFEYKTARQ